MRTSFTIRRAPVRFPCSRCCTHRPTTCKFAPGRSSQHWMGYPLKRQQAGAALKLEEVRCLARFCSPRRSRLRTTSSGRRNWPYACVRILPLLSGTLNEAGSSSTCERCSRIKTLKSSRRSAPQYDTSKAKLTTQCGATYRIPMAEPQHFIVATAGHVDHGKSALVKALTGTDPDRLPDEKARGITIDLGFAHLELPATALGTSSFLLGIVDVPGHEDFVKNMVAGVGSIDLALLVVAAADGWMPQTEEHLQILIYLGIKRLVVAVNKSDIADAERTVNQINQQLRGSPYQNAPVVSTCARSAE